MSASAPAQPPAGAQAIPLMVNIQYVKDMSFEVPNAPRIFTTLRSQPQVQLSLDVQARPVPDGTNVYEVMIVMRAEAQEPTNQSNGKGPAPATPLTTPATVFVAELTYAGVFTLTGVPEAHLEPILYVECPRLLFPYARNILAEMTRDGGFPPVLLQPVDFVAMWQARRAQATAQPAANA